jgi:hypothetical protein
MHSNLENPASQPYRMPASRAHTAFLWYQWLRKIGHNLIIEIISETLKKKANGKIRHFIVIGHRTCCREQFGNRICPNVVTSAHKSNKPILQSHMLIEHYWDVCGSSFVVPTKDLTNPSARTYFQESPYHLNLVGLDTASKFLWISVLFGYEITKSNPVQSSNRNDRRYSPIAATSFGVLHNMREICYQPVARFSTELISSRTARAYFKNAGLMDTYSYGCVYD